MTSGTLATRPPRRARWPKALVTVLLLLGVLVVVAPLLWLVGVSLLPTGEILKADPFSGNPHYSLDNYSEVLGNPAFTTTLINSLIVSGVVTVVGVYLGTLAGYAFAKMRFFGRDLLFAIVLATLSIPVMVTVIPNFVLMARIGLIGSLLSIILPQLTPPLAIFWMRQYIGRAVSDELIEAASLDGSGHFRTVHQIVLPIVVPGMAGLAVWIFMLSWNALLLPLAYIQDSAHSTYPVFLTTLIAFSTKPQTGQLVAAALICTVPPAIVYLLAQKRFISGLAEGATKE